jgi:hypothetical protein
MHASKYLRMTEAQLNEALRDIDEPAADRLLADVAAAHGACSGEEEDAERWDGQS